MHVFLDIKDLKSALGADPSSFFGGWLRSAAFVGVYLNSSAFGTLNHPLVNLYQLCIVKATLGKTALDKGLQYS